MVVLATVTTVTVFAAVKFRTKTGWALYVPEFTLLWDVGEVVKDRNNELYDLAFPKGTLHLNRTLMGQTVVW